MSLKARQQNAPSVEENRAVETLAAFLRLVGVLYTRVVPYEEVRKIRKIWH